MIARDKSSMYAVVAVDVRAEERARIYQDTV